MPGRDSEIHARGLNRADYQSWWREVKAGRTTWKILEEMGMSVPSKQKDRQEERDKAAKRSKKGAGSSVRAG